MSESNVNVTPGSGGPNIDLELVDNGNARQVITIGDPSVSANVVGVTAAGAAKVDGSGTTQPISGTVNIGNTPNTTPILATINQGGNNVSVFPNQTAGRLKIQEEPTQLFVEVYNTSTLDITNKWNAPVAAGGGVAAVGEQGDTRLGTGTTANGYSYLNSQFNFNPPSPGLFYAQNAVNLEFPVTTNAYRFWGFGAVQPTPTATNPIQDGTGWEVQTNGKLFAVTYSGGVRNIIQDCSSSGNNTQPQDASVHKYITWTRGDLAYWAIDNETNIVASMLTGASGPLNNNLPYLMLAIAGSVAPSSNTQLTSNAVIIADTSHSTTLISDGTYRWRSAVVSTTGGLAVTPIDGYKATYSAAAVGITSAATATDIFTITGSATKTIRILRILTSATQTTAGEINLLLVKRSTANSAGTSSAVTAVPHDSTSVAASATVLSYTANPTLGTPVGTLRADKLFAPSVATASSPTIMIYNFGDRPGQAVVLRGTSQVLALNLNSTTVTGGSFDFAVEWTEE